jgi:hypothetical protein
MSSLQGVPSAAWFHKKLECLKKLLDVSFFVELIFNNSQHDRHLQHELSIAEHGSAGIADSDSLHFRPGLSSSTQNLEGGSKDSKEG